ncbi:BTB/POZ domain-containing protein At3g19850 [Humulus lupulus]|uniref:BTB/POZ domain-containing protein At3g19850 n=1 Tax=Humulus lupulus TaxID=3486 RepID=UPI002B40ABA9|nr:BTB/POZ domain-containing protein At3g19850 [Humulus lupulus]
MSRLCNLQVHINGQETFFLNEKVISTYSEKLKKIVKQERRRTQMKKLDIEIDDFPGGPDGFELVSRFCHNNGGINITVTNVSLLYCSAVFLGMTEKISNFNLLQQAETFLDGLIYWSWKEILACLNSCESLFAYADSFGLLEKLICALLSKIIAHNSDLNLIITTTSSSSSSSPDETSSGFRFSSCYCKPSTPESFKPSSSSKAWWFDDLTILPPKIIERVIRSLGEYMNNNSSLILTKFLLHYLKLATHKKAYNNNNSSKDVLVSLADTAVHGVMSSDENAFSCRSLFWVLRILSGFGISKERRLGLERLIGAVLDKATLDDLMVSGNNSGAYDVNLVIRLVRVFVNCEDVTTQKLKKVGRLVDNYLSEISPDQSLKISKFLGVAESLPHSSRDSFDGVYRAIDIYLESHPTLSSEERSKLCKCLKFEKLSLEACKELAKNPKIPPEITIDALIKQQSKIVSTNSEFGNDDYDHLPSLTAKMASRKAFYGGCNNNSEKFTEEKEFVEQNLQRMQRRVIELEKVCTEMKGQMSRMVRHNVFGTPHSKTPPRLC